MPPDPTATAPSDRKVGFSVETIDIRLIRIFMAVVEAGGLSAAQLELNLALSTISEKVSALEKRFGMKLCQRGRSGFELTTAGVGDIVKASMTHRTKGKLVLTVSKQ